MSTDIYFIQCGWLVKIGHSTALGSRVNEIKYPSPAAKKIVGVMLDVHPVVERQLHRQFRERVVRLLATH